MNNVKESIGWADFTINPVKGLCPVDCKDNQGKSYCYARRMYKRFHWNPEIYLETGSFVDLPKEPARIFVGSTMELFGPWIKPEWMSYIMDWVRDWPQHTFIFLSKQPQNLPKEWQGNCWVGVSATDRMQFLNGMWYLSAIQAPVKFVSLEPLLERMDFSQGVGEHLQNGGISWVIIGCQTPYNPKTAPRKAWIDEIIQVAKTTGVPYFLKNNLRRVMGNDLVQDFPRMSKGERYGQ